MNDASVGVEEYVDPVPRHRGMGSNPDAAKTLGDGGDGGGAVRWRTGLRGDKRSNYTLTHDKYR